MNRPFGIVYDALGRSSGFALDAGYDVAYAFDMFGRFHSVSSSVSLAVQYSRLADTDLLEATTFTLGSSTFDVRRSYESGRSLITSVENAFGETVISRYDYANDELGRRTSVVNTGLAFSDAGEALSLYGYNARSEVVAADRHWGTDPGDPGDAVAGQSWAYAFDPIGNRTYAERAGCGAEYAANELNQYTARAVAPVAHLLGTADESATVTVNAEAVTRQDAYWYKDLEVTNATSAAYPEVEIAAVYSNLYTAVTGRVFVAETPEAFTYDDDGNLTQDGRFDYTWNGENRLIKAETRDDLPAAVPRVKVEYAYDHQGRMVWKKISRRDAETQSWEIEKTANLLWNGYNIVQTRTHSQTHPLTNFYTWGLDLSGSLQGAGGVGGLLAEIQDGSPYFAAFDANGNVTEYISTNGVTEAHYEYSPFGEIVVQSGELADSFTHRFSTKPWCPVTGLSEYEKRKYRPGLGRWLSHDPMQDAGGVHLYGFVANNSIIGVDYLGLRLWPWQGCCGGQTFNRLTQCCCRSKGNAVILDDKKVGTGIKRCKSPRPGESKGTHYWTEIDGWSAGFYGDPNKPLWGHPGVVHIPDSYNNKSKECEEIQLSPCDHDINEIKHWIKTKAFSDKMSPPLYNLGIHDCRGWSKNVIEFGIDAGKGCAPYP